MSDLYFDTNLRYLRKLAGKSQADVAFQVKKRPTAISSWETGQSQPSLDDLSILSDYFDIPVGDLIGIDLSNVHLNKSDKTPKKGQNVHLNVHPNVHLKGKKGLSTVPQSPGHTAQNSSQKMTKLDEESAEGYKKAIEAHELLNSYLSRRVAELERDVAAKDELIQTLKKDIPQIGKGMEDPKAGVA